MKIKFVISHKLAKISCQSAPVNRLKNAQNIKINVFYNYAIIDIITIIFPIGTDPVQLGSFLKVDVFEIQASSNIYVMIGMIL